MIIAQAIKLQGIFAAWRGAEPATGAEITQDYVSQLVQGLPRLQYGEGETQQLDLVQLGADFDALKAQAAATAAEEATQTGYDATVKADPTVRDLITATPAQIETYIANNVTDLASAREVLVILAKAVRVLGRREFLNS